MFAALFLNARGPVARSGDAAVDLAAVAQAKTSPTFVAEGPDWLGGTTTPGRGNRIDGDDYAAWPAGFAQAGDDPPGLGPRFLDTHCSADGAEHAGKMFTSLGLALS